MVSNIACYWYQNIQQPEVEPLVLTATYDPNLYPVYDNYNAIEVSRVNDIPKDYNGLMGVPVRFLKYYDSSRWELFDLTNRNSSTRPKRYSIEDQENYGDLNGAAVIRKEGKLIPKYTRLLIRRIVPKETI